MWGRVPQPQPGTRFSITGQLEETRALEIHVKLTRVEAAWESLGGMYSAGEAPGGPSSQLEGSAEALLPWGWGALCPPCPQGFAASPHHLAAGRLPARVGLCPLPRELQLPLREVFIYFNQYNEIVGDTPIYKMDTSQRSHWKGRLGQSLGSLSFALHTH